jgi:hypothetical protein
VVRCSVGKQSMMTKATGDRDIFGMTDSGIQVDKGEPETPSSATPFSFVISWRSLTQPEAPKAAFPQAPETRANPFDTIRPFGKAPDTIAPPREESASLSVPNFATVLDRSSLRKWAALVGIALLLVTIAIAAMRRIEKSSASPDVAPIQTTEMGEAGWNSEWVTDRVGSALGRQISLYRPSALMSDYHLKFTGRIERKSLDWVFRAADSRNYQVGKLQASKPGGPLTLVRFAVVRGVEDPHVQIKLPFVSGSGAIKVRLDAIRSRFTIYVQDKVVEDWQDDRLKTGGVGFLNEREEQGQVGSVEISFQKAGVR